jgi:protein-S-isoprenylcysteine O-methyltransferase Ste14
MKSSLLQINPGPLFFRFRVPIFLSLYLLGFLLPIGHGTLWLAASAMLARTGLLGLAGSTLVVTIAALVSLLLGAVLRVWGTAYLGSAVMSGLNMQGNVLVAAGPYRYVRNPLYLGSLLLALGVSILMPPAGAAVFLPLFCVFVWLLVMQEERFLTQQQGEPYKQYLRSVPRFFPRIRSTMAPASLRPSWAPALLAETYALAVTLCFAAVAWRYNARLLMRCVIICYGLSLVARALVRRPAPEGKPNWY